MSANFQLFLALFCLLLPHQDIIAYSVPNDPGWISVLGRETTLLRYLMFNRSLCNCSIHDAPEETSVAYGPYQQEPHVYTQHFRTAAEVNRARQCVHNDKASSISVTLLVSSFVCLMSLILAIA